MTDEEKCLELLRHADSFGHKNVGAMAQRINQCYLEVASILKKQRAALNIPDDASKEKAQRCDDTVLAGDIAIESVWANCLADANDLLMESV